MKGRAALAGVAVFGTLHVVVITGPAIVLALTADKGGLPQWHGLDLVAVSLVVGIGHALMVVHRLRLELQEVEVSLDAFIAAFDALVVLAMLYTALVMGVLGGFAPQHAAFINHGWPVVLMWVLILIGAVLAAEAVRSLLLGWLERDRGH